MEFIFHWKSEPLTTVTRSLNELNLKTRLDESFRPVLEIWLTETNQLKESYSNTLDITIFLMHAPKHIGKMICSEKQATQIIIVKRIHNVFVFHKRKKHTDLEWHESMWWLCENFHFYMNYCFNYADHILPTAVISFEQSKIMTAVQSQMPPGLSNCCAQKTDRENLIGADSDSSFQRDTVL